MKQFAAILLCAVIVQAAPRIVYTKSFPGSTPAFVEITVEQSGDVVYKEAVDDQQPLKFRLSEEESKQIFELAAKVDHFKRDLESGLKVARMGDKTYRWEDGAVKNETKFNYTVDLDGRALQELFEKISETEQHVIAVERSVRFDKLGVNKVLLQLQAAMERDRLVATDQFLPWLDRVAKNESYLNMARERAAQIAAVIRNSKAKAE
ncbi:MAG TPA: hypothetical protein VFB63_19245 [Bryobacteraceae bacterium]|jgi:hypothetical protein|nr:hypothetical protein [Bryobacteraceae bacterium]